MAVTCAPPSHTPVSHYILDCVQASRLHIWGDWRRDAFGEGFQQVWRDDGRGKERERVFRRLGGPLRGVSPCKKPKIRKKSYCPFVGWRLV